MQHLDKLRTMQAGCGERQTAGLSTEIIASFLADDAKLAACIDEGYQQFLRLQDAEPTLVKMDERTLIDKLQESFVNFYPNADRNPYVAVAARGPWIASLSGAVIHDSGGYGMLGFGHGPDRILHAMNQNQVMANIMTANFSQKRLIDRLRQAIGPNRSSPPFHDFICMNSGSESVTVACRISDINARQETDPGGRHAGKRIMFLAIDGGFHGRTDRPAQASSSTLAKCRETLASFRDRKNLYTVPPNDVVSLENAYRWAEGEGVFFECMLMEPVMGEGNPGMAVSAEFYARARELTAKSGTLLLVDSIQAAIRAHGCLSITDYPGFETLPPPDMETYSKAMNAGQYPLSVLGMSQRCAKLYVSGVYGNTMTTNPRALDVACAVLDALTPDIRRNIRERGGEFLEKFQSIAKEFPDAVSEVRGTGLLFCIGLNPKKHRVTGSGQIEEYLRKRGIGVIHGGENALRFTPHFEITSKEVDLICDHIRDALKNGPRI